MSADFDVVCCSLEPWDDVWRRNQFFAAELLAARPQMRMLFVEPAVDVPWLLLHGHGFSRSGIRQVGDTGRLSALTPHKWLPRRLAPHVDRTLVRRLVEKVRQLDLRRPVLWINDNTYAAAVRATDWPSVYDVTDDWLLAVGQPPRELARQHHNDQILLNEADEVVVCSPALERSRGHSRDVHLITNGVDVSHFRALQPRPADLPEGPIALYTGTLAPGRLDVALSAQIARRLTPGATVVLLGPNSLPAEDDRALRESGAVILGARPYSEVPAYLQHADVLVVPHVISPFTESLDPIKARELVAVGRPTVSTKVAGFRGLGPPVILADPDEFVEAVRSVLTQSALPAGPGPLLTHIPSWRNQAADFLCVLGKAADPR